MGSVLLTVDEENAGEAVLERTRAAPGEGVPRRPDRDAVCGDEGGAGYGGYCSGGQVGVAAKGNTELTSVARRRPRECQSKVGIVRLRDERHFHHADRGGVHSRASVEG